jgi:hypothetical protein
MPETVAQDWPPAGSSAEVAAFHALQARLPALHARQFADRRAPRSVIVVPSLSLDPEVLSRVTGVHHYEERMLCLLLLLHLPRTRVIYLSSAPIDPAIVDYYLGLLPGVPYAHARARLMLLSAHDRSVVPLTRKLLDRPALLRRVVEAAAPLEDAHLTCFTVTPLERSLAVRLGVPLYGCDPDLAGLGSKSGGRKLFREAGIPIPDGIEDLRDEADMLGALTDLKRRNPGLRRAVVKLNEGFSGEGNATFDFTGAPDGPGLTDWVKSGAGRLRYEAACMTRETFAAKLGSMGGIVEAFVEGRTKTSPSAQFRVDPEGAVDLLSTHDQILGGPTGQIFLGCRFPADPGYRAVVEAQGMKAARALAAAGVIGRFGIDFICVKDHGGWQAHAIEINLRKGGTTHPFLTLQFLTDGHYDAARGGFFDARGRQFFYEATDNLESPRYRGLTPDDLIDLAVMNDLHYHAAAGEGVVFHLIGALSEFGKIGMVAVGPSPERARTLFADTVACLDRATG